MCCEKKEVWGTKEDEEGLKRDFKRNDARWVAGRLSS
jgi:hypothetical protein